MVEGLLPTMDMRGNLGLGTRAARTSLKGSPSPGKRSIIVAALARDTTHGAVRGVSTSAWLSTDATTAAMISSREN